MIIKNDYMHFQTMKTETELRTNEAAMQARHGNIRRSMLTSLKNSIGRMFSSKSKSSGGKSKEIPNIMLIPGSHVVILCN